MARMDSSGLPQAELQRRFQASGALLAAFNSGLGSGVVSRLISVAVCAVTITSGLLEAATEPAGGMDGDGDGGRIVWR